MKKILLSSAIGGLAALTIGLAAPATAAPAVSPSELVKAISTESSKISNSPFSYKRDDHYPYSEFGTVQHPYYDSLIPKPESNAGVRPGQLPAQVPGGPIVGRR